VGPRAGRDYVEKRKFLIPWGLESDMYVMEIISIYLNLWTGIIVEKLSNAQIIKKLLVFYLA
jgi:hypothetical protein